MQYGAYARKMSQTGKFDYFDIAGSQLDIHVEYYDEAKGANIVEYDIDVVYKDITGGGANSVPRTDLKTIVHHHSLRMQRVILVLILLLVFRRH